MRSQLRFSDLPQVYWSWCRDVLPLKALDIACVEVLLSAVWGAVIPFVRYCGIVSILICLTIFGEWCLESLVGGTLTIVVRMLRIRMISVITVAVLWVAQGWLAASLNMDLRPLDFLGLKIALTVTISQIILHLYQIHLHFVVEIAVFLASDSLISCVNLGRNFLVLELLVRDWVLLFVLIRNLLLQLVAICIIVWRSLIHLCLLP